MDELNIFGDVSEVYMFTFMGMCGELLLYQRILLPGKAKVFVVSFADRDSRWVLSKSIFEDILSLVLQNRFADIEQLSDPQNEALFGILNREDVFTILPTSTGHGKSIIFQCLPDLCRKLFLRRFPYPSNAIVVVVCPLNFLVKSHIRELHTREITAK